MFGVAPYEVVPVRNSICKPQDVSLSIIPLIAHFTAVLDYSLSIRRLDLMADSLH